jgi:sortase A
VSGVLALGWGVLVWRWQDPFTALYTTYEQHELSNAYDVRVRRFRPAPVPRPVAAAREAGSRASAERRASSADQGTERRIVSSEARRYRLASHEGDPLGKILVPRIGLDMIFVDGTTESSLERGPGRDLETSMPGENRLVYIAGHRTTYLAPFSHIDALRKGDRITLELPYGTFVYRVTRHVVVPADDLSVLRPGHEELLALQACHPRFFATHRYIVYARPTSVVADKLSDLRAAPALAGRLKP